MMIEYAKTGTSAREQSGLLPETGAEGFFVPF